jgi:hypothetical protein
MRQNVQFLMGASQQAIVPVEKADENEPDQDENRRDG